MRGAHIAPVAFALLSLAVAITACGAGHPHTATATPPASTPTLRTMPGSVLAGVAARCSDAPPYQPGVRPGSITLACADNGIGVENMTWDSWTPLVATGHGRFWEKLCRPNCADGKTGTYPVAVTLSAVKFSSSGPWFSRLTVSWPGKRPPGHLPGSFPLPKP